MNLGMEAAYFVGFIGFAAYGFGGNPSIVASVLLVMNSFYILGSLVSGTLIDKFGPRLIAFIANLGMVAATLAGQFTSANLTLFLVFAAVAGALWAVQKVAFASFSPYLEQSPAGFKRVNSLISSSAFFATILGPLLGGVIASAFPAMRVFIFAALVIGASAAVVLLVRQNFLGTNQSSAATAKVAEQVADSGQANIAEQLGSCVKRRPLVASAKDVLEGLRTVVANKRVRFYLLVCSVSWGFLGIFYALESVYYKTILHLSVSWMGWLNGIMGMGLVVGVLLLARLPQKATNARLLVISVVVSGIGTVIYVATQSVYFAIIGAIVVGVASGVNDPLLRTLTETDISRKDSGRVLGAIEMFRVGLMLVPTAVAPLLSSHFGVQPVLIAAGVLTIVVALLLMPASQRLDKEHRTDSETAKS